MVNVYVNIPFVPWIRSAIVVFSVMLGDFTSIKEIPRFFLGIE